jgi:hypothetical protein
MSLHGLPMIARLTVGLVFLVSALAKLESPASLAAGLADYHVFPPRLSYFAGVLLIVLEASLAVFHLMGWQLTTSALLGLVLLASFSIATGVNLRRGRMLPCYCFGKRSGEMISRKTLLRLCLLCAAELCVLVDSSQRKAFDPVVLTFWTALFWSVAAVNITGWLLSGDDLVRFVRIGASRIE